MKYEEALAHLKELEGTQGNEPSKPSKDPFWGSEGSNPGVHEKNNEALDRDEDGTLYGDKPILKTAEEMAATEPDEYGWKDPWKQRVRTTRR